MTRPVTSAVAAALASRTQAPRYFLEMALDSGTVRFWDGLGTIVALGVEWSGVGRLGRVIESTETKGLVAGGLKFELAIVPTEQEPDAPDAVLNIALAEEYQGRPCVLYEGMVDLATRAVIEDPYPIFGGFLDVMEDSELPGAAVISVSAESELAAFDRPKKRLYTPEDQKAICSGDTFFDDVVGLQNREITLKR